MYPSSVHFAIVEPLQANVNAAGSSTNAPPVAVSTEVSQRPVWASAGIGCDDASRPHSSFSTPASSYKTVYSQISGSSGDKTAALIRSPTVVPSSRLAVISAPAKLGPSSMPSVAMSV